MAGGSTASIHIGTAVTRKVPVRPARAASKVSSAASNSSRIRRGMCGGGNAERGEANALGGAFEEPGGEAALDAGDDAGDRAGRGHRRHHRLRHGYRTRRTFATSSMPTLPGSVEAYYQEIGRGGRDGAPAEAHMLYGLPDIRMRRQFIEEEDAGPERRRREHKRLDALLGYCEAPSCRRVALLEYFGEHIAPCGNCDVCLDPTERVDATQDAQKILSAAYRTGERFGAAHLIDIVRGARTEKAARFGHDRVPTFGGGGCGPQRERLALGGAPDGGGGTPSHRHRGLRRARHHGSGPRAAARQRRVPVPRGRGDRARAGAGAAQPPRRRVGAPAPRRRGGPARRAEGVAARARARARGAGVHRVPRPHAHRHGAAPAAQRGGVRRWYAPPGVDLAVFRKRGWL